MSGQQYRVIMRGERVVDCYDGPECDQHKSMWKIQADGDMDESRDATPLVMRPEHFPPGTIVEVRVPICGTCQVVSDLCHCGFDWKKWAEDKYA